MNWLFSRAILFIAGALLALQGLVIYADTVMPTYFVDELMGFLINTALVWLVTKLHGQLRSLKAKVS